MNKIEKLTLEQEEQLTEFRQKWFNIGSCTDPANKEEAENAIIQMYKKIGKATPKFIWVQSPATALLCCGVLKKFTKENMDSLWASLGNSLGNSLRASLWDSLRASLGASLWDSLRASLRASLWDSLWASLGNSLGNSLPNDFLGREWWGQHEAYWISFYLFPEEYLNIKYERSEDLHLWKSIAESCCWWFPFENICIVSDRPEIVKWETDSDRPRLHCEDGPALKFRDGYTLWCWKGLRVSQEIIEHPENITIEQIDTERNLEIKRILIERYGLERFIKDGKAKIINEDTFGTLYYREMKNDEPLVTVKVKDASTDRIYFLRVPPDTKTAKEAVAWTFNLSEDVDYKPMIET